MLVLGLTPMKPMLAGPRKFFQEESGVYTDKP